MDAKNCPVCGWDITGGGVKVQVGGTETTVCSDECAKEAESTLSRNMDVIQRVYQAFNQADYPAVLESFAPTIEWVAAEHSPLSDRSPYRGIADVREGVFVRIAANFERLVVHVDEIFAAGERVVALGFYEWARRANGKSFRAQVAHIWTLADGKVVKFQQYVDTYQLAEASKND